jgi:hypothetical protein
MELIQAEFSHGETSKVVWVDKSWKLKVGDRVTFKDDDRKWLVEHVYELAIESSQLNEKCGLNLPKSQRTEI